MKNQNSSHKSNLFALALGALGVVFGDIGTSPLYALRECFSDEYGLVVNSANILGVLSLIFWTIIIVICVKYMVFVMRADNKGEGGILSILALAMRTDPAEGNSRKKWILMIIGIFGAALLYGDGIITPAISVLSAVEGMSFITPVFEKWVIPVTVFIMNALFLVQRYGTGRIGLLFGPIIFIWFLTIGILGIYGISLHPSILESLNPLHAIQFFYQNGIHGFLVMGSVFLVVTGGEALYADMGHFGRKPIRLSWFIVAMPALILNYLGQGALLLSNPEKISNPFYQLAPNWALWPLVILSTFATVIASQALISGVFSITRQAVQLGYSPRLNIIHTSSLEIGQIYVPFINWVLFIGVIWLVLTFQNSSNLAAAYGIAVTGTMVITTILAFEVAINKWKWNFYKALIIFGIFVIVDLAFLGANLFKITHGGWVPLALALMVFTLMTTWKKGRQVLYAKLKERSVPVDEFFQNLLKHPPLRVSGTAIYMAGDQWGVPVPLLHNLKHNKVLHERIALLTIITRDIPTVPKEERVHIEEIIPNFYRLIANYGFMETPKMKHILDALRSKDIHFNVTDTTFVLGRETILPTDSMPAMSLWRERIFAIMTKNAQRPTSFFRIPPNQVIEVGIQIEI